MQPKYEGTSLETVEWEDGVVKMIDQTRLPQELVILEISDVPTLVAAIRRLSVRGAPAIGVAGAYGVALAVHLHGAAGPALDDAISSLRSARPTAVNLAKMVDRTSALVSEGLERVLDEAHRIRDEELEASVSMGEYGADLADELIGETAARTMTICNTGGLATVARGTGLAVIVADAELLLVGAIVGRVVAVDEEALSGHRRPPARRVAAALSTCVPPAGRPRGDGAPYSPRCRSGGGRRRRGRRACA